jgi:hypothetical protein
MSAYQPKTTLNDNNVNDFLQAVGDETRRKDSFVILDLMTRITGQQPKMWGTSIVGFGSYSYTSKSGINGDWMKIGFAPRKQALTIYLLCGFDEYDKSGKTKQYLAKLGKHKIGKSCLYIKKLTDIDMQALEELIKFAWGSEVGVA